MGYVLITGASSGIGYELAKIYAENGSDLIMVGSNEERLQKARDEIRKNNKIEVETFSVDLSKKGEAESLYNMIKEKKLQVNILINNAGVGLVGEFLTLDTKKEEDMMWLDMNSLVILTRLFSNDMKEMGKGKILNVSSNGAFQPGPYVSTYYAAKSFVYSFTQAIAIELNEYGIKVSTLCPGATATNFGIRSGKKISKMAMSAEVVARIAYKQFGKGQRIIIPGLLNHLILIIPKYFRSLLIGKSQKSLQKVKL